jgi:hypothetical protein
MMMSSKLEKTLFTSGTSYSHIMLTLQEKYKGEKRYTVLAQNSVYKTVT